MSYQVIARRFRPSTFEEVVGQDLIVKTLKNSLLSQKLAHAYLFCGLRGTGKTTLARLLAKAMNCEKLLPNGNPCHQCGSCQSFQSSTPLDFIEIDGASHRGIDDIKTLLETVTYSSTHKFKIILIDEVHMLTKEAFNALLKTLEEPPEHVKFIFATTEAHKLPSTILSRCQRFDLASIKHQDLKNKLKKIALELNLTLNDTVFDLIADRSEGSLRDAESLFERIIASSSDTIELNQVYELLGFFGLDLLQRLDLIIAQKNIKQVFTLAQDLFNLGKDMALFFDQYRQHLRHILCAQLNLESFVQNYPINKSSLESFTPHELTYLIEVLTDQLKTTFFDKKIDTEALLLHLVSSKGRSSLQDIVTQLQELTTLDQCEITPQVVHTPQPIVSDPSTQKTPEPCEPIEDSLPLKPVQFYDTLMQFTAVELEGSLKK
jgi:DNA polymerase-3 subunit gamma/tau